MKGYEGMMSKAKEETERVVKDKEKSQKAVADEQTKFLRSYKETMTDTPLAKTSEEQLSEMQESNGWLKQIAEYMQKSLEWMEQSASAQSTIADSSSINKLGGFNPTMSELGGTSK